MAEQVVKTLGLALVSCWLGLLAHPKLNSLAQPRMGSTEQQRCPARLLLRDDRQCAVIHLSMAPCPFRWSFSAAPWTLLRSSRTHRRRGDRRRAVHLRRRHQAAAAGWLGVASRLRGTSRQQQAGGHPQVPLCPLLFPPFISPSLQPSSNAEDRLQPGADHGGGVQHGNGCGVLRLHRLLHLLVS